MNYDKIIIQNLELLNDKIKQRLIDKRIQNTGEAANSLKVVQYGMTRFASVGVDYIEVLNKGRRPGKWAPVNKIKEWVKTKLGISNEKDINSISFLVNRKIKEDGTKIFQDKRKGLMLDELIEETKEEITKDLTKGIAIDLKLVLSKFKQQFEDNQV